MYHPVVPNLWAFSAVTVPFVLTPGSSTAVVLRNSLDGGRRAGIETAVGVNAGSIAYGVLTAAGFAFLLQQWPSLAGVLRAGGFVYLLWLAFESFRDAWKGRSSRLQGGNASVHAAEWRHNLSEGFMTNALNPSIAAFYLLIIPQFFPRGASVAASALVLTAVHVSIAFTAHVCWSVAGGALAPVFDSTRAGRILHILMGVAMAGLAVKVVW